MDRNCMRQIDKNEMNLREKNREKILSMTLVALFCVLMIVSAKISLLSFPVPLTFQLPTAVLSGMFLGWKRGVMTQTLYLIMGLAGLPVFASGGGLSYVLTPTFGFLFGFIPCAFAGGYIYEKYYRKHFSVRSEYALYVLCGLFAIIVAYFCGTVYMYIFSRYLATGGSGGWSFSKVIGVAVLPFVWKDVLLLFPIVYMAKRLKYLRKRGRS